MTIGFYYEIYMIHKTSLIHFHISEVQSVKAEKCEMDI